MGAQLILTVLSVIVFAVCVSAARGNVEPNNSIGIRTTATTASKQAWRTAHRAAARVLCPVAIAQIGGILLSITTHPPIDMRLISLGVMLAGLVIATLCAQLSAHHNSPRPRNTTVGHSSRGYPH